MVFRIGLENNIEGRSLAWVLGHPGCYAYGIDGDAALAAIPEAIREYRRWVAIHPEKSWFGTNEVDIQVDETWEVFTINEDYELVEDGYEVNAWFRHDWRSLTAEDIERGLELLDWSRADLLESVRGLTPEGLEQPYTRERWNIAGILKHVGGAEWWYLDRLGLAFPRQRVPDDPFERLAMVRAHLVDTLPRLVTSRQVVGIDGEFWSPRKMVRRAVWHERDHTEHIWKLRNLG